MRIGEYAHEAKHRGFDTWDLRYVALDSKATLSFFTDPDGVVSEAVVRFEDVAASVRYNRVKDETG